MKARSDGAADAAKQDDPLRLEMKQRQREPTECRKPKEVVGEAEELIAGENRLSLVRNRRDGVCFDRVESAFQRYVANPGPSRHEIWSLRHRLRRMSRGNILRVILAAETTVVWSNDGWTNVHTTDTNHESGLTLWFADFPTADWAANSVIEFSLFWKHDKRWQGQNRQMIIL